MITFPHLLVFGLAVWRISSLLVHEDGPYMMFRNLREWAGIQHDDGGQPWVISGNFTAQVLSCVWCSSIWVSLFFALLYFAFPIPALRFATIFAFSSLAILIEKYLEKK